MLKQLELGVGQRGREFPLVQDLISQRGFYHKSWEGILKQKVNFVRSYMTEKPHSIYLLVLSESSPNPLECQLYYSLCTYPRTPSGLFQGSGNVWKKCKPLLVILQNLCSVKLDNKTNKFRLLVTTWAGGLIQVATDSPSPCRDGDCSAPGHQCPVRERRIQIRKASIIPWARLAGTIWYQQDVKGQLQI